MGVTIFSIFLLVFALSTYAQDKDKIARSDSLFAQGVQWYHEGKYREAIPLFAESDSIDKAVLDSTSNRRDYSAMWLASCHYHLGDTQQAIFTHLDYRIKPVDRRLTVKSDSLSAVGVVCYNKGKYAEALEAFKATADLEEKIVGKDHAWYARSLLSISVCYESLNDTLNALENRKTYCEIVKGYSGKNSIEYLEAMYNMGIAYSRYAFHEEAVNAFLTGHEIEESIYYWGGTDLLYKIAQEYYSIGKLYSKEKQRDCFRKSLSYLKEYDSTSSPTGDLQDNIQKGIIDSFIDEVHANRDIGNYQEAIRLCEEALGFLEREVGKNNAYYMLFLNYAAEQHATLGNYQESVRLGMEALNLQAQLTGTVDAVYAKLLSNLAAYKGFLGQYAEALRYRTEVLDIQVRLLGTEHRDYADALSRIAECQNNLGNYAEAVHWETKALDIRSKVSGTNHDDYLVSLHNLAVYKAALGNYAEAISLETKALEIYESACKTETDSYAISIGSMANLQSDLGNHTEAIRLGTEALNIFLKTSGRESAHYAVALHNLAKHNSFLGNYDEAFALESEAFSIYKKIYGERQSYRYQEMLSALARYSYNLNNNSDAVRFSKEVMDLCEKFYGKQDSRYIIELGNYAFYSMAADGNTEVTDDIVACSDLLSELIKESFASLNGYERRQYWSIYKVWLENYIHRFAYRLKNDTLIANGYNSVLFCKGLLLNSEIEFNRFVKEYGDEKCNVLYDELCSLRRQADGLDARQSLNADSLEALADVKEHQLLRHLKSIGNYAQYLSADWKQVSGKLQARDVAVEFVSFPNGDDSVMYAAYLLHKDAKHPKLIPLFSENELKEIQPQDYYTSEAVGKLVWKPLEAYVKDAANIYFSPSGLLYNIAIESVPSTTIADKKCFRLSSTRQLVLPQKTSNRTDAAVYGGLRYDLDKEYLANDTIRYPDRRRNTDEPFYNVSDSIIAYRGNSSLPEYLPATLLEAEFIVDALKSSKVYTMLYSDSLGTETSFKALSGKSIDVIHVATHGFYFPEYEHNRKSDRLLNMEGGYDFEANALKRSGLLFSGVHWALKGERIGEGMDDGILTAKEISLLDLNHTELVVLSACQTGLGEITSDGVLGLQRGFKKAGVKTLMMSLWKVDDKATQLLMKKFYTCILRGESVHDALREAQRYVRMYEMETTVQERKALHTLSTRARLRTGNQTANKTKRTIRPYEHPKYWAAFVLLDAI